MTTSYYVRETGGSDSNGGTSHGDAWATIQHALNNMSSSNDRLNINGSHTLSASLDFTTYGNPGTFPLAMEGYTSLEGDGGIGHINGGGNMIINATNNDYYTFRKMKFTNWGSSVAFDLDNFNIFMECEFDGEGARVQALALDADCIVMQCKFHGFIATTQTIIEILTGQFLSNYVQTAGGECLSCGGVGVMNNIFSLNSTNSAARGVMVDGDNNFIQHNVIFNQAAGTGKGIDIANISWDQTYILDNIVAGFSGTGGVGIESVSGAYVFLYGNNKFWNNDTNESLADSPLINLGSNDTLGGNPFNSTGNVDPDDDDFGLASALPAYLQEMYLNPSNATLRDAGALINAATGSGGFIPLYSSSALLKR